MSKILLVLRHAKAAQVLGLDDHERPLTERGLADARGVGDHLREQSLLPDRVLCSTSLRTRQTFDALAIDVPVSYERGIYANDVADLRTLIRVTGDDVGVLLLIGHNPSFHELAVELTGQRIESFPTSALAVIEMVSWEDGDGGLTAVRTPRTG
ncbi:MAG: histidine phosphatase family protein [Streptosporangiaceae bacterium]